MYKKYLSIISFVLTTSVFASSDNLLSCKDESGVLYDCVIKEKILDEDVYPYQVHYDVTYNYFCNSDFYLELSAGGKSVAIPPRNSNGSKVIRVSGSGPLKVYDTNPFWTQGSYPTRDCNISIFSTQVVLSNDALSILNEIEILVAESLNVNLIETKQKEAIKAHSMFVAASSGQNGFYCLIKDYDTSDRENIEDIVFDLKNQYTTMYGQHYNDSSFECPVKISLDSIINKCKEDKFSHFSCPQYLLYLDVIEWFNSRIKRLNKLIRFADSDQMKININNAKTRFENAIR